MMTPTCTLVMYDNTATCITIVPYIAVKKACAYGLLVALLIHKMFVDCQYGPGQPQVLTEASKLSTSTAS